MLKTFLAWITGLIGSLFFNALVYIKGSDDNENKAIKAQNDRLNNRPRTSNDIERMFDRIIIEAKNREQ